MPHTTMLDPPGWGQVFSTWRLHPALLVCVLIVAFGYVEGVRALNRRHPRARWPWWRTLSFLAGLAVVVAAIDGSVAAYGEVLFWVHMIKHLMLIMLAPWLLALGYPLTLLLRATRGRTRLRVRAVLRSRPVRLLTHPLVTLGFYVMVVIGVHLSGFMQAMMEHASVGWLESAAYLLSGYLFFSQTMTDEPSAWDLPHPLRLFLQFVAMSADTLVGVVLLQTAAVPWAAYADPHRDFGPSPLDDLHGGAAVMWIGGDGLMVVMMIVIAARWLSDRRPEAATAGRWLESARRTALSDTAAGDPALGGAGVDVDTDEGALAAYNAMLARLAERERQH
jgi:cytochrome c oxidase assembly factor CtaG